MSALRTYLIAVVSAGLLCSVVLSLVNKPSVQRVVRLCCGCFLALVALSPLYQADFSLLPDSFLEFSQTAQQRAQEASEKNERLLEELICEQCEQRIAEQAAAYGATVAISVELRYDEKLQQSAPYAVTIESDCSTQVKKKIQEYIAAQLGIPPERQKWGIG